MYILSDVIIKMKYLWLVLKEFLVEWIQEIESIEI